MKGFGNDIAPCNLHEGIWKQNGVLQTCKKRFGIEMASCKADSPYIFLNDILKQKVGKMDKKRI